MNITPAPAMGPRFMSICSCLHKGPSARLAEQERISMRSIVIKRSVRHGDALYRAEMHFSLSVSLRAFNHEVDMSTNYTSLVDRAFLVFSLKVARTQGCPSDKHCAVHKCLFST